MYCEGCGRELETGDIFVRKKFAVVDEKDKSGLYSTRSILNDHGAVKCIDCYTEDGY